MSYKTVEATIEYSDKNLSAYIDGAPIVVVGNSINEIEKNMREAVDLYLESCKDMNIQPAAILQGDFDLKFRIDAATLINCYSNVFTKAALSRITGINERQLWHYAAGVHRPRKAQLEKIQSGIKALSKELSLIDLV